MKRYIQTHKYIVENDRKLITYLKLKLTRPVLNFLLHFNESFDGGIPRKRVNTNWSFFVATITNDTSKVTKIKTEIKIQTKIKNNTKNWDRCKDQRERGRDEEIHTNTNI